MSLRRILFVTHASCLDRRSGGAVYSCNVIEFLAGQDVTLGLLVLRPNASDPALFRIPWKLERLTVLGHLKLGNWIVRRSLADLAHHLVNPFSSRWAARLHDVVARITRVSKPGARPFWNSPLSVDERALLQHEVMSFEPDYIFFNHYFIADYRPSPSARTLVGILTHEIFFDRQQALATSNRVLELPGYDEATERRILSAADHLLAINTRDATILKDNFPAACVDIVLPSLRPAPLPLPPSLDQLLFIGGDAEHNVDALAWLLDHLWPAILLQRPSTRLVLCGSICRRVTEVPPGVIVRGVVADLRDVYAECSLSLVPIRIGSGLKTRIIESFAFGRPVVTTPVGLQGLDFVGAAALCASDSDDFVRQTLALLSAPDRLRTMSEAALRIIEEHFSPEATLRGLRSSPLFICPSA
ncbi:MAG: hypothetical protein RIQ79_1376 [Verrucomicrobiota bacterium]